ncbi:TPA: hypothetical protein ACVU4L_001847 [Vibrio parahaemolyticus]|uniref:Uncharacterized protein n=2 Tax=Vibrio TaxID=662 RepID=A0A1B1LRG8_VIBPH|nr:MULTISPECIES: hypothetical protein [Vibrio]ANS55648.1 hypothetical protein [Vibrio parahaemolyticus]MBL4244920.1 hypothetical protein [Vibrio fluvialis]MBL4253834.1 hypothetical protein [Vibrio fluvialis]MCI9701139.1 hypothetical protein [Vibrio parahaemolyticus]MCR9814121.1 hypothetical protein [Vibrio parahaemolyticus]
MAVLPKAERLALLAQSTYGSGTGSNSKTASKQRRTGFRQVSAKQLPQHGNLSLVEFNDLTAQQEKIETNPHKQEIIRLDARPDLISKDREHYEQTLFFDYVFERYPEYYNFLAATPNGGFRRKGERFRLCAEGQKAGWPDCQFACPKLGFHGLYIEFKRPVESYRSISEARNALKPHQLATLRMLLSQGYAAKVAYGSLEAIAIFESYIGVGGDYDNVVLFCPKSVLKPPEPGEVLELKRNAYEILEAEYA